MTDNRRQARPGRKRDSKQKEPFAFRPNQTFPITIVKDAHHEINAAHTAKQLTSPETAAHRLIRAAEYGGDMANEYDTAGVLAAMRSLGRQINTGDLSQAEAMLAAQAVGMQTLAVRLIERGMAQQSLPQFEAMLRLGLKAQAQSRLAIEAIAAIKHGPAVLARTAQVNVAHGPQQVNNGGAPDGASPTPAREALENPQSKLLLLEHGKGLDTGKAREASAGDQALAPVGAKHRAAKR